ncbi:MAG: translation initiation factor IF-3, partial [Selenomonas massiliensis]
MAYMRASEPGGVLAISRESLRINEEIHIREVRVTSAEGEQLGIML